MKDLVAASPTLYDSPSASTASVPKPTINAPSGTAAHSGTVEELSFMRIGSPAACREIASRHRTQAAVAPNGRSSVTMAMTADPIADAAPTTRQNRSPTDGRLPDGPP